MPCIEVRTLRADVCGPFTEFRESRTDFCVPYAEFRVRHIGVHAPQTAFCAVCRIPSAADRFLYVMVIGLGGGIAV